jgi:ATPase subunit of ABC transporter with duplicated ATPase domains
LAEIEENPLVHPQPKSITGLSFIPLPLLSEVALEINQVSKSFGTKSVLSQLTRRVLRGERVVIRGPNGCGKSTLLGCISGAIPINSGSIWHHSTAKMAYLDQGVKRLPMQQTPSEYFSNLGFQDEQLALELHKAGLGGFDLIHRRFEYLSVGQRKRLMLLFLILAKPNLLLLDEPTNHLDFLTLEAFEKALLAFEGTILAVSHDQHFTDKIATSIWNLS